MTQAPGRIVAGIGFATAADANEIIGLIKSCLTEAGAVPENLVAIGTHARKLGTALPLLVAAHFAVPLRLLDDRDLAMEGLAEGVAAAAGSLLLRKRVSPYATCALAVCGPAFRLESFGQPPISNAAIASSTLATSWAGP